jgi:hypothetical protein
MKRIIITLITILFIAENIFAGNSGCPNSQPFCSEIEGNINLIDNLIIGDETDADKYIYFDGLNFNSKILHDTTNGGLLFTTEPASVDNRNYSMWVQMGSPSTVVSTVSHHTAIVGDSQNGEGNSLSAGYFQADRTENASTSFNFGLFGEHIVSGDSVINATAGSIPAAIFGRASVQNSLAQKTPSSMAVPSDIINFAAAHGLTDGNIIHYSVTESGLTADTAYSVCGIVGSALGDTQIKLSADVSHPQCGGSITSSPATNCASCDSAIDITGAGATGVFTMYTTVEDQLFAGVVGEVRTSDANAYIKHAPIFVAKDCSGAGTIDNCYNFLGKNGSNGIWQDTINGTGVMSETITISSANILDATPSPVEIIAGRAGAILEYVSGTLIYDESTAYACGANDEFVFEYETSGDDVSAEFEGDGLLENGDAIFTVPAKVDATIPIATDLVANVGKGIMFYQTGADCTTGAGVIRAHVTYKLHVTGL